MSLKRFRVLISEKNRLLLEMDKLSKQEEELSLKLNRVDEWEYYDPEYSLFWNGDISDGCWYEGIDTIDDLKKYVEVIKDQINIFSGLKKNRKRTAEGRFKLIDVVKKYDIEGFLEFYGSLLKIYEAHFELRDKIKQNEAAYTKVKKELEKINKEFENNLREKLKDQINDKVVDLIIKYDSNSCGRLDGVYIGYDYILEDDDKMWVQYYKNMNKGPVLEHSMDFCGRRGVTTPENEGKEGTDWNKLLSRIHELLTIDNWFRIDSE